MQTPATVPLPPTPPAPPNLIPTGPYTAAQMYRAAEAYREVLGDQLRTLQSKRRDVANELANEETRGVDRSGLETRLRDLDARILNLDKAIAAADEGVATAARLPGATERPPEPPRSGPPDEAYALGAFAIFTLGLPFAIAYSRRIWRRSAKTTVVLPPEVAQRMQTMEEAIESIAVEVERVGEGQRFMTQALSEGSRIGAGAAQPVPVRQREAAHAERPV